MDREDRIRKLWGGTDTARWAAAEIERMHAELELIKKLAETAPIDRAILKRAKIALDSKEDAQEPG